MIGVDKVIATHVPRLDRNMKVFCKKCGKKFIKQTQKTTLCDDCWHNQRKNCRNNIFTSNICQLCLNSIDLNLPRISLATHSNSSRYKEKHQMVKRIGLYHRSCWDKCIAPILLDYKTKRFKYPKSLNTI